MKKLLASLSILLALSCAVSAQVPNGGSPMVPNAAPQVFQPNLKAYFGQVATNSTLATNHNASFTTAQTRSRHYARDTISSLQIAIPNWYVLTGQTESGSGATATVTASVEYPSGTCTQVLFSGVANGSITSATTLLSDALPLTIPRGSAFFVRMHWSDANGIIYTNGSDAANGEAFNFGGTAPDRTVDCSTVPDSGGGLSNFRPAAVVANTVFPSTYLLGDSRVEGVNDTYSGTSSDIGELARSIGPSFAYINGGIGGDTTTLFISSHALRLALAQYCSHVILQLGINDVGSGTSNAQLKTNLQTIANYFLGTAPVFLSTMPPNTTSTDSWATLTNQTLAGGSTARGLNNTWRLTVPAGFAGVFNIANVVESGGADTTGKWIVNGAANYGTSDGLHESPFAYLLIQQMGVINPSAFYR